MTLLLVFEWDMRVSLQRAVLHVSSILSYVLGPHAILRPILDNPHTLFFAPSWTNPIRYSVPHLGQTPYAILCPILDKPHTLFCAPSWTNPIRYSVPQNGYPFLTIERYPFDVLSWRAELLGLIFLVET